MSRYLIRGGKVPYEKIPIQDYLTKNIMGSNVGNFMYLHGIVRTIMTDDTVSFESTNYRRKFSKTEIDRFNSEFDGFIIPLADAFRADFVSEMEDLTDFIKKLKIPVYIIGIGISSGAKQKLADKDFCFEKQAKGFVDAVLEKSACIGVRGDLTGEFMSYLGYKEGRDFSVIGCASMYTFGRKLNIRDVKITPDSRVAFNGNNRSLPTTINFLDRSYREFKDVWFVTQVLNELRTLYLGMDYMNVSEKNPRYAYPHTIEHPLYAQDRVKFFLDVNDWVDFMKTVDFTFGSRFHGNVPATIAGTPSLFIVKDERMEELTRFHKLTAVSEDSINDNTNIWDLIAQADFHSPETVQEKNFDNYIEFMHKNGLKTIYDEDPERTDAPLDEVIKANGVSLDVKSVIDCSTEELMGRIKAPFRELVLQRQDLVKEVNKLKSDIRKKNEAIKNAEEKLYAAKAEAERKDNILRCRPLKAVIKVRNAFSSKENKIKIDF